eukprot:CAMPEP_0185834388 /NCGR_PEP_ID=MMETSP1353-20130828/5209_1 /TAXON_ID=1077150 /ORGANISM="Erythrolobus australicus, Strain CCMP3124" /LENGTH=70 /DNA_ID=CAMNT_0028532809 /DNA_START=57 /DNA_END=266 /DNA_ORIENTATION=-
MVGELPRLCVNRVVLGDFAFVSYARGFAGEVFAGLRLLNLRNDALRRKVDAVKYDVKRIEDITYDLAVRK